MTVSAQLDAVQAGEGERGPHEQAEYRLTATRGALLFAHTKRIEDSSVVFRRLLSALAKTAPIHGRFVKLVRHFELV
jgi:hypothetical protein